MEKEREREQPCNPPHTPLPGGYVERDETSLVEKGRRKMGRQSHGRQHKKTRQNRCPHTHKHTNRWEAPTHTHAGQIEILFYHSLHSYSSRTSCALITLFGLLTRNCTLFMFDHTHTRTCPPERCCRESITKSIQHFFVWLPWESNKKGGSITSTRIRSVQSQRLKILPSVEFGFQKANGDKMNGEKTESDCSRDGTTVDISLFQVYFVIFVEFTMYLI